MSDIDIRPLQKEDFLELYNLIERNRKRLLTYFPKTSANITSIETSRIYVETKIKQELKKEQFFFGVISKTDGCLVGGIIIKNVDWSIPKAELAYFIDGAFEGKGVISKAIQWLVNHCFTVLGFEKLYIKFDPDNTGSKRVAIKNGFVAEGFLKAEFRTGEGKITDVERYGLLKEDWLRQNH